ncbi:CID domain-containing protein 1 [Intoshia linei]|uniref:CID domain-containing protein 1 n=1 Tax=Intoshia linei TaxID=1819745 RepID=A0A177B6U6_9BILA|nr:CID domain-containing protein 1 [Intoshia linei]
MTFNKENFEHRLKGLTRSQGSIETLSLWMIHYRSSAQDAVDIWLQQFKSVNETKKLNLLYLANDVIQNGRKFGNEYIQKFKQVFPTVFKICQNFNKNNKDNINSVLQVWKERKIFDLEFIKKLNSSFGRTVKEESSNGFNNHYNGKDVNTHITTDKFVEMLAQFKYTPSCDPTIRIKVSQLDKRITDISYIKNIKDINELKKLQETLVETTKLLAEYNSSLYDECMTRSKFENDVCNLVKQYKNKMKQNTSHLKIIEKRMEELQKLRNHTKKYLTCLPDFSTIENHTSSEYSILPSVKDLFS